MAKLTKRRVRQEDSLAGREGEELKVAEAAGKSRSKAKNSAGNL